MKGRRSFTFSDIRYIIAEAALGSDFDRVFPKYTSFPVNFMVTFLLLIMA